MLSNGVIPADLPGVGDKNQCVVENAIRDLKRAGTVLVFTAHDDRIGVNKELKQHLRTSIDAGKIDNIVLVLPRIDTMKKLNDQERDGIAEEDLLEVNAAESRLTDFQRKLGSARREQAELMRKGDSERFMAGSTRCDSLAIEYKAAESAVLQAHIKVRCERLKEDAAGMLKAIDKGKWAPELKVFPVSNEQYQLHLAPTDGKAPFLDRKATGVPALRRYLLTATAMGKSERLEHLCLQTLPLLLNGAEGVLTKSPLERKDALRKIIKKTVKTGQDSASEVQNSILEEYENTVTATIEKHMDRWCVKTVTLVSKGGPWAKMHGGTFGAVCNRQGYWKRKRAEEPFHFNHIIFEIIEDGMTEAFTNFDDKYRGIVKDFHTSLKTKLTKLQTELTEGKMVNLGSFEGFIKGTLAEIQNKMDVKFKKLQEFIDHDKKDEAPNFMLEEDDEDNWGDDDDSDDGEPRMSVKRHLVGAAMVKVYVDCLASTNSNPDQAASPKSKRKGKPIKKKGKQSIHKRRLESMQFSFSSKRDDHSTNTDNVFRRMGALAKGRLEVYLEEWATDCNKIVYGGLKSILIDFDKRFQETEVKNEGDKDAVRIFLKALQQAGKVVHGELKGLVAQFTSAKKKEKVGEIVSLSQDMSKRI